MVGCAERVVRLPPPHAAVCRSLLTAFGGWFSLRPHWCFTEEEDVQAEAFGLMAQATASLADMFDVKDHAVAALLMQHMVGPHSLARCLLAGAHRCCCTACCPPPPHPGLATHPTC